MSLKEYLEKYGSIRKAAEASGMTKSKFMVAYKKEQGLCTATTACKSLCEPNRTRCREHLQYAVRTRDPVKKQEYMKHWIDKNREYKSIWHKEYQKKNLHKFRESNKRYLNTPRGATLNRAKRAKYRASKLQATPSWVDKLALLDIYENCPDKHHVDHIIPLQNDQVCGLHVPWNLQYLSGSENDSKGNSFDGTQDNEGWRTLCYT